MRVYDTCVYRQQYIGTTEPSRLTHDGDHPLTSVLLKKQTLGIHYVIQLYIYIKTMVLSPSFLITMLFCFLISTMHRRIRLLQVIVLFF